MPSRRSVRSLLAAAALAAVCATPAWAQGRPDCTVVLRKMHDAAGHGGKPDAVKIGRKLGVDPEWVDRCAEAYGRHLKPHAKKEGKESAEEQSADVREAEEWDELSREEKETAGDRYYTEIENDDQDRRKIAHHRDDDSINEWDPIETHEWNPDLGHEWRPFIHNDDIPDVE